MELEKFKEKNKKQKSIVLFTIACVLLITGVFLYKTFAIYKTNMNQDMINGEIQDIGDIRFMVYVDDVLQKEVPKKEEGYSLDTSSSYCDNGNLITWNDERWSVEVKNISTTKTKCYLKFKKIYKEDILNGAIPDLMNGRLVPITISDTEKPIDITYTGAAAGKVTKADITKTDNPWYSYQNKQWANAVILRDGKEDTYKAGDEIPESEIESYFVWIPRYKYKLKENESTFNSYSGTTNLGNQENVQSVYDDMKLTNEVGNKATNSAFEIEFETKDNGDSNGSQKDQYLTHPAFVSFDSNGFWVGKFETGYNQNSTNDNVTPVVSAWNTGGAQKNEENASKVIIKPNVYSWRNINVANAFYTAYNYKRELESHMMKNSEWGAVAYLTQSKYGRCDNNSSCTEMNRNNSEYYITGMSTTLAPTCGYTETNETCNWYGGPKDLNVLESGEIKSYYLTASKDGSTTGNYSGIYDMSGGAWEYVMGVMQSGEQDKNPASGTNKDNNSGFNGPYTNDSNNESKTDGKNWPSSKYYDLYDYNTSLQEYQRGHLGDATKEIGSFYSVSYIYENAIRYIGSYNADLANFANSDTPWFGRGAAYADGTEAGVFAFINSTGSADSNSNFRIILTP